MNNVANVHASSRKTQPTVASHAAVALTESLVRSQSSLATVVPTCPRWPQLVVTCRPPLLAEVRSIAMPAPSNTLNQFSGGHVSFIGAQFPTGTVNFDAAQFSGGMVSFSAAFSGGVVDFSYAEFSGGTFDFDRVEFSGGMVDFSGVDRSSLPVFLSTDTPPPGVKLPKMS